jgi:succinate dehydrogenase/fumarate reductase cytochrome b subunit
MPRFLSPVLLTVQWLLLFVLLTIYGAMWNGAQQNNQKGWVVAVLWSTVILVVLNGSHGIYRILFDLQAFS